MKKTIASILTLAFLATATQQAHALQEWYLQPPGTGPWDWSYFTTVNFANSSDGTDGGFKYEQFQGQNTSTNGHCIELETQFAGVANMDTRIYVFNGTSTIAVNNNFGGTLYSRARFWMQSSGGVGLDYIIRVRANNAATNSGAFRVKFTRRDITEAACTTGQASMPWAKMKTNANSNNWGVVTVGGNPT